MSESEARPNGDASAIYIYIYIYVFSLVRNPAELDSVGDSTKIEGQKRSSAWC